MENGRKRGQKEIEKERGIDEEKKLLLDGERIIARLKSMVCGKRKNQWSLSVNGLSIHCRVMRCGLKKGIHFLHHRAMENKWRNREREQERKKEKETDRKKLREKERKVCITQALLDYWSHSLLFNWTMGGVENFHIEWWVQSIRERVMKEKKERGKRKKERGRRKVSKDANEEGDTINECYNTNNCNVWWIRDFSSFSFPYLVHSGSHLNITLIGKK